MGVGTRCVRDWIHLSLSVSLRTLAAENGKRRIPLCHTVIDINPLDERAPPIGKLNFP